MRKNKSEPEANWLDRPPDFRTPLVRLFEKPYSEWTGKQRLWFSHVGKQLFSSRRGRPKNWRYDSLFKKRERAIAKKKFPGIFGGIKDPQMIHIPSLTELASKAAEVPVFVNKTDPDADREKFIRAYQRRKKSLKLPAPPED